MSNRVMIIDDDSDQRELMKYIFKMVNSSVKVITARDGDEALQTMLSDSLQRPGVILLDLRMPKKDGIEVLKELKANSSLRTIPVCILSNGDLETDIRAAYEHHASFYFKKPSGMAELKKFVENLQNICFEFALIC